MLSDGAKRCGCGAGCKTFGACLRGKRITTTVGLDTFLPNFTEHRLDEYDDAVRQGVQPATTQLADVRAAMRTSDATGTAFRADEP